MALNAGPENLLSTQAGVGVKPAEETPPLNPEFPYTRVPFEAALFHADRPAPEAKEVSSDAPVDSPAKG